MTDGINRQTARIEVKSMVGWYLLCVGVIFVLIASGGNCKPGGIVYCYEDSRDFWWHPSKILFAFFVPLLLPIPHVLISLLFKERRNIHSVAAITKKWHRGFVLIIVAILILAFLAGLIIAVAA